MALEPSRAPCQAHEVDVDLRADAQRLAAVGRADEAGQVARGGQRCPFVCCCLCSVVYVRCCFSRNASFMRTVFCEYTLYFLCAFCCDFLLLLLLLSPFFGIVSLGGSERRKWPVECTLEQAFLALPSPRALRF